MLNIEELESRTYGHNLDNQWMYANARENFPKTFEQDLRLFSNYEDVVKDMFNKDSYNSKLIRNIEVNEFLHRGYDQTFREFLENDSEVYTSCSELNYKIYSQVSKVIYQMCHKLDVFESILHQPWHALREIAEIKEEILDLNATDLKNLILNFETEHAFVYSGGEYFDHYKAYKAYLKFVKNYSEFSSREKLRSLLYNKLFMSNDSFNRSNIKNRNRAREFNFERFIEVFINELSGLSVFSRIIIVHILNNNSFNERFSHLEKIASLSVLSSNRFDYTNKLNEEDGALNVILECLYNKSLTPAELATFAIKDSKSYFEHKNLLIRNSFDVELLKDSYQPIEWIYSVLQAGESKVDYEELYSRDVINFLEFYLS